MALAFARGDPERRHRIGLREGSLGELSGALGVDGTNLEGDYDINLTWTNGDEPSLAAALAAYGLELRKETRKVPILYPRLISAPAKPARKSRAPGRHQS